MLIWNNGRREEVQDYILNIICQRHVSMIVTDQAYGSGTMIADDSNQIIAPTAHRSETYPQAIIDLPKLRQQRQKSWNFQQYRPDLHQLLLRQVPQSSSTSNR